MIKHKKQMILAVGVIMLLFSACNKAEINNTSQTIEKVNQMDEENIVTNKQAQLTVTIIPTLTPTPTISPIPTVTPTPVIIPVLRVIQIEAGTTLDVINFFASEEDLPTEETSFTIERNLTKEELRQAGVVYEIPVTYNGYSVIVSVEIIDTTPPTMKNIKDIEVFQGDSVSYKKGIKLTDNADGEVVLTIENSNVNLKKEGTYIVKYTATDTSGNSTTKESQVLVKYLSEEEKEKRVNKLADEVIAKIITEDMSKWDTCYKLWNWCRTKIRYAYSAGDRSSIYAGAYEGLHNGSGDCYAYYATFTILLEKCGIETMEVRRIGGTSDHWWNLVNLGDGWYHCDSSPRKKGDTYKCFMQTDAQVQAYTESYIEKPNYYVFDESLYPERETTIVYGE